MSLEIEFECIERGLFLTKLFFSLNSFSVISSRVPCYMTYIAVALRNLRSLIKKHCSVISIMSRLSNVCVIRHTVHGLSESESISSSDRTRDAIYSICSV